MSTQPKYCGECGVSFPEDAIFCGECGTAVSDFHDNQQKESTKRQTTKGPPLSKQNQAEQVRRPASDSFTGKINWWPKTTAGRLKRLGIAVLIAFFCVYIPILNLLAIPVLLVLLISIHWVIVSAVINVYRKKRATSKDD